MKNQSLFYFIILLVLISIPIIGFDIGSSMKDQLSEEDKMFYGFIEREGKTLGKKYNMRLSSVGGGGGIDRIWLMSLSFDRDGAPLTEEEARRLIISVVNDYIDAVNSDELLRAHLRDYPFSPKNIELTIYNSDKEGNWVYYPFIIIVNSREGKVGYFTKEESKKFGYKTKKHESWDEAVTILKKEKEQKSSTTQ